MLTPQPRRSIERAQNKAPAARRHWPRRPGPLVYLAAVYYYFDVSGPGAEAALFLNVAASLPKISSPIRRARRYRTTRPCSSRSSIRPPGGGCCPTRARGTSACRPTRSCSTALMARRVWQQSDLPDGLARVEIVAAYRRPRRQLHRAGARYRPMRPEPLRRIPCRGRPTVSRLRVLRSREGKPVSFGAIFR